MARARCCEAGKSASTSCGEERAMADIVEKSWDVQRRIEERTKRLGKGRYGRVLKMARKPTREEYSRIVMITGVGLLLIGAVGFVIYWIMKYGPGFLESLFR